MHDLLDFLAFQSIASPIQICLQNAIINHISTYKLFHCPNWVNIKPQLLFID